jgi:hypothetical protein
MSPERSQAATQEITELELALSLLQSLYLENEAPSKKGTAKLSLQSRFRKKLT